MSKRYGMTYLGSKEKILHLINYIFQREYKKTFFIDLFAGGFSVSSFALQKSKFNVISNDLNIYMMSLYNEIIFNKGRELEEKKYDWVSRIHFEHVRDHIDQYPKWYVGMVLNVWSFGCDQRSYIYAKDLEENKKALHQAIVFNDYSLMNALPVFEGFQLDKNDPLYSMDYRKYPAKRVAFMGKFKKFIKDPQNADRIQHLERVEQLESLNQIEHMSGISKNIPIRDRLKIMSEDWYIAYKNIPTAVLENSVIYCDPPYEDSKNYLMGKDFDYNKFWRWFMTCPYPVYASSYKAPYPLKPLNFEYKAQLLDNGKRGDNKKKKVVKENLYWNGKGTPTPTIEDVLFGKES